MHSLFVRVAEFFLTFLASPDPVIAPNTMVSRDLLVAPLGAQCADAVTRFRYDSGDTLTVTITAPGVQRCTVYVPRTRPTQVYFTAQ